MAVNGIEKLSVQIQAVGDQVKMLSDQIECLSRESQAQAVAQARQHAELEARVQRAADNAERAHQRIDKLSQGVWAIAVPIVLMMGAYIWDLITHSGVMP